MLGHPIKSVGGKGERPTISVHSHGRSSDVSGDVEIRDPQVLQGNRNKNKRGELVRSMPSIFLEPSVSG